MLIDRTWQREFKTDPPSVSNAAGRSDRIFFIFWRGVLLVMQQDI